VYRLHVLGSDGIDQPFHLSLEACQPTCRIATSLRESIEKKLCIASMAWEPVSLSALNSLSCRDVEMQAVLRYIPAS
jgi:hypothetical protein